MPFKRLGEVESSGVAGGAVGRRGSNVFSDIFPYPTAAAGGSEEAEVFEGAGMQGSVNQNIFVGGTTVPAFDEQVFDVTEDEDNDMVDLESSTTSLTVKRDGIYGIGFGDGWAGWDNGPQISLRLLVNGSVVTQHQCTPQSQDWMVLDGYFELELSADDVVSLSAYYTLTGPNPRTIGGNEGDPFLTCVLMRTL